MPANTRYGGKLSDADIADIRVRLGSPSVIGGTNHNLLSATHADTASAAASQGALIVANSSSKWAALAVGAASTFLRSDGTSPFWSSLSGLGGPPALSFSTAGQEGTAGCFVRIDATIILYDSTLGPCTITPDAASATGTSGCAARRDHIHGIDAGSPTTSLHQSGANAEGTGNEFARATHTHAILSSSNPGAAASLLATSASGAVAVRRLAVGGALPSLSDQSIIIGTGGGTGNIELIHGEPATGNHELKIRPTDSSNRFSYVRAVPNGPTGGIVSNFQAFLTDWHLDTVNYESVEIAADKTDLVGRVRTNAGGTGTLRPLSLTVGATLTNGIYIDTGGKTFIGDTANANMTQGLTINQGAADNEIIALKSSDVVHGMTTETETDTYGLMNKAVLSDGGTDMKGISSGSRAMIFRGFVTTRDTSKSTTSVGAIELMGLEKSGTTVSPLAPNANIVAIRLSNVDTRFIFDADGDFHADAAVNASSFDAHDDAALVRALELERNPAGLVRSRFDEWVRYNRADLQAAGIATFNDGPDGDGSIFLNYTALARLHSGALWQLYTRLRTLESQLTERTGSRFGLGISSSPLMG